MSAIELGSKSPCLFSKYHAWLWDEKRYLITNIFLAVITLFPLSYAITGILSLLGRVCCCCCSADDEGQPSSLAQQIEKVSGIQLRLQIEALKEGNQDGWQEAAIDLIRKQRREDPDQELQRLREAGILTPEIEQKMNDASPAAKVLFAQALEIQSVFGDTHYVFLHGQPTHCIFLPHLLKELEKRKGGQDLRQFKVLRPLALQDPQALGLEQDQGIDKYKNSNDAHLDIREPGVTELLSVDASPLNRGKKESAFDFVQNNPRSRRNVSKLAREAIREAFPKASEQSIINGVAAMEASVPAEQPCGNLFVICIPKNQIDKTAYRSHNYGVRCRCEHETDPLDDLQAGRRRQCLLNQSRIPQYRLYMPEVRPGTGQHSYLLTPMAKAHRKAVKQTIRSQLDLLTV